MTFVFFEDFYDGQPTLQCHPDKGGSSHQFSRLNMAKNVLTDVKSKKMYDKWLLLETAQPFEG